MSLPSLRYCSNGPRRPALRAFPGLIARYPTWEAMAGAPLVELQEGLRPLGLWRQKARALLELANVVETRGGELPSSRLDLERLPGIGPYTASALMAAVFGLDEPLVDVNMSRVLGLCWLLKASAYRKRQISRADISSCQHRTSREPE